MLMHRWRPKACRSSSGVTSGSARTRHLKHCNVHGHPGRQKADNADRRQLRLTRRIARRGPFGNEILQMTVLHTGTPKASDRLSAESCNVAGYSFLTLSRRRVLLDCNAASSEGAKVSKASRS